MIASDIDRDIARFQHRQLELEVTARSTLRRRRRSSGSPPFGDPCWVKEEHDDARKEIILIPSEDEDEEVAEERRRVARQLRFGTLHPPPRQEESSPWVQPCGESRDDERQRLKARQLRFGTTGLRQQDIQMNADRMEIDGASDTGSLEHRPLEGEPGLRVRRRTRSWDDDRETAESPRGDPPLRDYPAYDMPYAEYRAPARYRNPSHWGPPGNLPPRAPSLTLEPRGYDDRSIWHRVDMIDRRPIRERLSWN